LAKKAIKKPKAKAELPAKKSVKAKVKPTPKSKKEIEKPNTKIELKQDV
jgi:hypothetical protein